MNVHIIGGGTPWWLASLGWIVPGAIGVVGVLIGQRFAERREDRRLEKERALDLRTRRHDLYKRVLPAIQAQNSAFVEFNNEMQKCLADRNGSPPTSDGWAKANEQITALLSEIDLIAGDPLIVHALAGTATRNVVKYLSYEFDKEEITLKLVRDAGAELEGEYMKLLRLLRADIGLVDDGKTGYWTARAAANQRPEAATVEHTQRC